MTFSVSSMPINYWMKNIIRIHKMLLFMLWHVVPCFQCETRTYSRMTIKYAIRRLSVNFFVWLIDWLSWKRGTHSILCINIFRSNHANCSESKDVHLLRRNYRICEITPVGTISDGKRRRESRRKSTNRLKLDHLALQSKRNKKL